MRGSEFDRLSHGMCSRHETQHMPRLRLAPFRAHARFRVAVAELGVVRRLTTRTMKEEPQKAPPSLDEFMQSATFQAHVAETNSNITHGDFVAGVQSATLGVSFIGEPSQLLRGWQKAPLDRKSVV